MLNEVKVFLSAMVTGFITGFAYDLLRLKRRAIRTRKFIVSVEDILFWIFAAVLAFTAAYISNQGEIRPYFFMGMTAGMGIYFWLLSRLVIQIIIFTFKIAIWPFAKLVILLKPPVKRLAAAIGKVTQKMHKKASNCRFVIRRRFRSIRHIMRKI